MSLILISGTDNYQIINSINSLQIRGKLKILNHPKIIKPSLADLTVYHILNLKSKRKSKVAVAFFVNENDSHVINLITEIRPNAQVVVVGEEYGEYSKLEYMINNGKDYNKFKSSILHNEGMIDYSYDKKNRYLKKSNKLNSYFVK